MEQEKKRKKQIKRFCNSANIYLQKVNFENTGEGVTSVQN